MWTAASTSGGCKAVRAAVYGAGALGTVLGAALARGGVDVTLFSRSADHVAALNASGARITGLVDWTVPVHAAAPAEMDGVYDVIFLMTKQMGNAEAAPRLKAHLAPEGAVCVLQNGIPEPDLANVLGKERIVGGVVTWNAVRLGPGQASLSPPESSLTFQTGTLPGAQVPALETVEALLRLFCPVTRVPDLLGLRWSKLLINAVLSCPASILGGRCGDVMKDECWRRIALHILQECVAAGHAAGVAFCAVQGHDYARELAFSDAAGERAALEKAPALFASNAPAVPSMLLDLQKGRPCEIEGLNGVICRTGRAHGVPTPCNDMAVALIRDIAAGRLDCSPAHAARFAPLLPAL